MNHVKTNASLNSHLIEVEWKCSSLGQNYVSIKSVDLGKSVRINRDYSFGDNRQIEYILDLLGLDFIAKNSRGKKEVFIFDWNHERLEENFTKKNLNQ